MLGALLAFVHYFSEKFHLIRHVQRMKFISFSGGVFVSYIILHLLPDLYAGDVGMNRTSLVFVLIGFSIFHLIEKFMYKHEASNREALKRELKELHSLCFFFYHLTLGTVLVSVFTGSGFASGVLFFMPLILIAFVNSISLKEIHGKLRQNRAVKLLLSVSTLLGAALATAFPLTELLYSILLGFVAGALLFTVMVDSLPRERKGEPLFFVLGASLYSLLIGFTWLF